MGLIGMYIVGNELHVHSLGADWKRTIASFIPVLAGRKYWTRLTTLEIRNKMIFQDAALSETEKKQNATISSSTLFTLEQIAKDCSRIDFHSFAFFSAKNPLSLWKFKSDGANDALAAMIGLSTDSSASASTPLTVEEESCQVPFFKPLIDKMVEGGKISKADPNPSKIVLNYPGCSLIYILVSLFLKKYSKPFVQGMCDYAQFALEATISGYIRDNMKGFMKEKKDLMRTFDDRYAAIYSEKEPIMMPRIEFTKKDLCCNIDNGYVSPLLMIEFRAYQLMSGLITANRTYIFDNEFSILQIFVENACALLKNFSEMNKKNPIELPLCYSWFMLLGLRELRSMEDRFLVLENVYQYGTELTQHKDAVMFLCLALLGRAVELAGEDETSLFHEVQNLIGVLRGDILNERTVNLKASYTDSNSITAPE